jgi:hypothetical protein
LTQPNIHKSEDKEKIEIDITDDDHEWVERIGKTAYEICNDPARSRFKLNEQHTGFVIESNDAAVLGCIGWAIEQYLSDIPTKIDDVKARTSQAFAEWYSK